MSRRVEGEDAEADTALEECHWLVTFFCPWKNVTFSPEESNPAGCHCRGHNNLMSLHEEKKLKMR